MPFSTGTPISQITPYTGTPSDLLVSGTVFPFSHGLPSSPVSKHLSALQMSQMLGTQFQPSGTYTPVRQQAYIDGLSIDYITSGSIRVNPGQAYVPSLNRDVVVTGSITQAFTLPIPTGTWQHVYLWENSGVASIQVTGTAPSNPYAGRARTKTGNTAYRSLGSLLPDDGGYLYRFDTNVVGGSLEMNWIWKNDANPFAVASNVSGTTSVQTASIAGIIPATGLVDELTILGVVTAPATSGWAAGIGATILDPATFPSAFQSAEMYFRVDNQSASPVTYFFPPGKIKIKGSTIQHISNVTTIVLSVRVRGIRIPRS
jgi:hypothetical protein